ncbi:MAG: endonuclease [Myxococcales bacterium]
MSATSRIGAALFLVLGAVLWSACPTSPPEVPEEQADASAEAVDAGAPEPTDAATPPGEDAAQPEPSADAGPGETTDASAAGLDAAGAIDAGSSDTGPRPYEELDGLRDGDLEAALYDLVKNHTALNYDNGSKIVMTDPGGFDVIDGKVECIYSGQQFDPSQRDVEGGFNMEHSWPKSDGAGQMPAESDLNHLFPAERVINSSRSSYEFGDTDCTTGCRASAGGSKLGPVTGGTKLVFQVRPERQGDIARAHFYFAVRYKMNIPAGEEAALRRWNLADPPDDRERARNLAIEVHQKKRNPFVDRPDFVDRISDF